MTGVSLVHTRTVHVLEPFFSPYEEEQAIGRAVRFDSHSDLPAEERRVDVVSWLGVMRPREGDGEGGGEGGEGGEGGAGSAGGAGDEAVAGTSAVVGSKHLKTADERVRDINQEKRVRLNVPWKRLREIGTHNLDLLLGRDILSRTAAAARRRRRRGRQRVHHRLTPNAGARGGHGRRGGAKRQNARVR